METPYKSKQDWIDCGLVTLTRQGASAVSASRLAANLGVTRGSFYHHFANLEDFISALLQAWAEQGTLQGFRDAKANSQTLQDEIDHLLEFAWSANSSLEVAVRAWATRNTQVAEFVARIDRMRLAELTRLYQALANDESKGSSLAKIAFYGLLGAYHAQPPLSAEQLRNLLLEIQSFMLESL